MRFSEETLDQVRQAVDLVDLVGGHVQLRKAGQSYKGLCPFHDEKTPSFTVNPDRQAYHCFGCGAGGDAFRFVMETEKLPFVEAVKLLAERYGVALPQAVEDDRSGALYRALEEAATFYRRVLQDPETGRAGREYLARRGVTAATAEEFGLGLAPAGWDALASRLVGALGAAVLLEAGLVARRERGEGVYDRFRNRLVVPLRAPAGKVVGFGGRALGDEEPKYLNSPETPVYHKGRFLFGLDRARGELKSQAEAVLVEGYFDLIALAQAGVPGVVATSGTALTPEQCRLLRRYAPQVALVFDGDAAGQAAAEKALAPATAAGLAARVVSLPAGEDPDTLVRGGGRVAWERALGGARSPVAFLKERYAGQREAGLRAVARLASLAPDPLAQGLLVEEAARAFGFDEASLRREAERLRRGEREARRPGSAAGGRGAASPAGGAQGAGGPWREGTDVAGGGGAAQGGAAGRAAPDDVAARALESSFLELLVGHPELLAEAAQAVDRGWFRDPVCRALAARLLGPPPGEPVAVLSDPELDPEVRGLLSGLLAAARTSRAPERAFAEGVGTMRRRALEEEQRALARELERLGSDAAAGEARRALLARMQETAQALAELTPWAARKERG